MLLANVYHPTDSPTRTLSSDSGKDSLHLVFQLWQIIPIWKFTVALASSALFGNNTNHIAKYGIADPLNSLDWIAFKPTNGQLALNKYLLITIYFQKMGRDGNSKYMIVSVTSTAVDRYEYSSFRTAPTTGSNFKTIAIDWVELYPPKEIWTPGIPNLAFYLKMPAVVSC